MSVIRHTETRTTVTPNAVMTTLASPTQGGAATAVWKVVMSPNQAGPLHAIDAEQVWTVLAGGATVLLATETFEIGPGDTVVMPADVARRISSHSEAGFEAMVAAPASMRAYLVDAAAGAAPTGAVRDEDKLVPAWIV